MNNINFSIVTGTGRCGTQFLAKLLSLSSEVTTRHDPNPMNLTFHRYSKWYGLPIDHQNYLSVKEDEIKEDLRNAKLCVHSSAHFALSIEDLYDHFQCKIIVLYRHPADVVNSYLGKGYYEEDYVIRDASKALGYHSVGKSPHHFFGRIVPNNDFFFQWKTLTRVGKIAWMWNTVNQEINKQLTKIPDANKFACKIEDFTYSTYRQLCDWLSIVPVGETAFEKMRSAKVNTLSTSASYSTKSWSPVEAREFTEQVKPMADLIGYDINLNHIIQEETRGDKESQAKKSFLDKIIHHYWR